MLMAKVAGGSWFSTPTQGKCASTTEPFNGAGGKPNCTWKDMGIGKIANFTCINSGLNRAVRAKNMTCFDQCPDGNQVYPVRVAVNAFDTRKKALDEDGASPPRGTKHPISVLSLSLSLSRHYDSSV